MAACTANEKSIVISTLQNTTYCYFLSHAIPTAECSPGNFPIKRIHEKCETLTAALFSLLLSYDEARGVVSETMHPQLTQSKHYMMLVDLCGKGTVPGIQDDGATQQYSYVFELYDSTMGEELPVEYCMKCAAFG